MRHPQLEKIDNIVACEGGHQLGILDGIHYLAIELVISVPDNAQETTIIGTREQWYTSHAAQLVEAQHTIRQMEEIENDRNLEISSLKKELQSALERANRVAWLETEVARLTRDLQRFREQEAAQRHPDWQPGAFEVQHLRDCDAHNPPICSLTGNMIDPSKGVCQCSWCRKVRTAGQIDLSDFKDTIEQATVRGVAYRDGKVSAIYNAGQWAETNSHIAPEAPIFRKLCQCDDCREMRAVSGYPAAEIEGH